MSTHGVDSTLPYRPFGTKLSTGATALTQIRTDGSIYVDKTDMILDLASNYKKIFLSRPRRFGKTLLVSTFETLFRDGLDSFRGARRLYRDGAFVEEPFKIAGKWDEPRYPVVRLDLSCLREDDKSIRGETIEVIFRNKVLNTFKKTGFRWNKDELSSWLEQLEDWLLDTCSDSSIVLLIDEYDAGLGSRLDNPESFSRVLSLLSSFFTVVKSAGEKWRFLFITGITRFSKTSIFSGMNDLEDITFNPQFGTLLGYTEDEIRENFAPYLESAASVNGTDIEGLLRKMREHYDGFCFDDEASTHVYAPWSVLKFLRRPKFINYWVDSGGNTSLLFSYMRSGRGGFNPLQEYTSINRELLFGFCSLKSLTDSLILSQAGYLTIAEVKPDTVILTPPNLEVAQSYAGLCLQILLNGKSMKELGLRSVSSVLEVGKPEGWVEYLNAFFNSIPYGRNSVNSEADFQRLLYALICGNGIFCTAEKHNTRGRSDLEAKLGGFHWIMELKYVRDKIDNTLAANSDETCDAQLKAAMAQIKEKEYGMDSIGLKRIRMGLVFSSFHRKIVRWGTLDG